MATPGWIELFVARLDAMGIPYMVTGSVASMIYGEPRLTLDVDIVLELQIDRADAFLDAFPESEFYRPPLEVVRAEAGRDTRGQPVLRRRSRLGDRHRRRSAHRIAARSREVRQTGP